MRLPYPALIALLSSLTAILFVISLVTGPASIGFVDSLQALFTDSNDAAALVMQEIRLPRAILALVIGASLGLSGAVLQGYLQNSLAEPNLIGVSSCAALGAVIALYSGLAAWFPLALPIIALLGALTGVLLILGLAGQGGGSLTIILAGVAISAMAGALTSLALNLSSNPFAAIEIVHWLLGSLADRSMEHVYIATPFMVVGWLMLLRLGRALDALTLGEETAANLGINIGRLRLVAVIGTACAVGAATSIAGAIGFIGLVVPHLLRPLVQALPSRLLPASAIGGAAMLLAADIAVRVIAPDRDLKLGVLTALVGAPFFLWLILRQRRQLI